MAKSNKRKSSVDRKPLVSVVVTTKNEEGVLARLLQSIDKQVYKNIEMLVIDNKSSDSTKKIAKKFTKKVFDKGPERSAQRNFGAKKSKGKYLLFLDADMQLSEKVVMECVELARKNKKVGAITIPEESVATNFWEEVKAFERSFYNLEGDLDIEAARFFSSEAFESVGGYDVNITGPEDWDLPESIRKEGYKQKRIKAKIYHYERIKGPFSFAKKKYYYALKSHRYLKKHNVSAISPKTIYFLRPVFYKHYKKIIVSPMLSMGMLLMLSVETIGGGLGYIKGKFFTK
jgi:glycosyltransferase involved in cell wall biosynthesis